MRELITCLHLRSKKLACPQSMRVLTAFTLLLIAGQATAGEQVISVQHDSQRGVTCWIIEGTGISCLPDGQLQNQPTLAPEQDQDGPTPAATPAPRSNEERFQL